MAYFPKYQVKFTNEAFDEIDIQYHKKDSYAGEVTVYDAVDITMSYNGDDQSVLNTIIGCSLEVKARIGAEQLNLLDDLVDAEQDTWLCLAYLNGQKLFIGYVLPDEEESPFQDRPYTATITAVDGFGVIKTLPIVRTDGDSLRGEGTVITLAAAALQMTGLMLPIMVIDNVFHRSHLNRDDDMKWDWMSQTMLDYRTFQKDATTFTDAANVLEILFKDTHRVFQWNGRWVIARISMIQYFPYVAYYTLYDPNGANQTGYEITEDYATIGKNELTFFHSEDQLKKLLLAVKNTKTVFNYNIWPEIPLNNKFERGEQLATGIAYDEYDFDGDGDTSETVGTFTTYKIEGWSFLKNVSGRPSPNDPTTSSTAYRKIISNQYGTELLREVILEHPTDSDPANANNLWSSGIPVIKGDRLTISIDFRSEASGSGSFRPFAMLLKPATGFTWFVNNTGTNLSGPFQWVQNASTGYVAMFYPNTDNINAYHTFSIDPGEIPVNGTIYFAVSAQDIGSNVRFKNFSVDYKLFVSGGYLQVTGESWEQEQLKKFPDTTETEVFISNNQHKVLKGCMLGLNGVPLTPDWYRMGNSESLSYLQITNLGRYNLEYRRFMNVSGSIKGIQFAPSNQQENYQPIGLHKQYRLVDMPGTDRRCLICAPLEMDLVKAWMKASVTEVAAYNTEPNTVVESVDHLIGRIRSAIDNTTEASWNAASGAPAHGTPGFPPTTFVGGFWLSGSERSFGVVMDQAHTMTATAVNIGGDHVPTIDKYFETSFTGTDGGAYRLLLFQIGAEILIGDVFTFHAYGVNVGIAVENVEVFAITDGLVAGNIKNEFKYIF